MAMASGIEKRSIEQIRADFPGLHQEINGFPLVYLDNAATAQKPRAMIEATSDFYAKQYANVHRGIHTLSQKATDRFEAVREKIRVVLHAPEADEIIFTKGCTEAINLVATCYAVPTLKPGDEILLTGLEHHSNIVPWQLAAQATGAIVKAAALTDLGELDFEAFRGLVNERTKIVACVHISNAIGTINPIKQIIAEAKKFGAVCLVDGAQAGPHAPIDVVDLGADFYTLSCHKMYGPTGVGVLWGRRPLLETMPPYQGGGSMIRKVTFEETTFAEIPAKFEPGTPNIAGFIGFGATLDYLANLNAAESRPDWTRSDWVRSMDAIGAYECELEVYGRERLESIAGVRVLGPQTGKAAILSFTCEGVHPHDIGHFLDLKGIAVRVGHHCCQPTMRHFEVAATTRASLGLYNTKDELDRLAEAVAEAVTFLS